MVVELNVQLNSEGKRRGDGRTRNMVYCKNENAGMSEKQLHFPLKDVIHLQRHCLH